MNYTNEIINSLPEKALTIRVETDALLTAVQVVMRKQPIHRDISHIPVSMHSHYHKHVEEKINAISRRKVHHGI